MSARPHRTDLNNAQCCGGPSWRGTLCQYHDGLQDGLDAGGAVNGQLIEALRELREFVRESDGADGRKTFDPLGLLPRITALLAQDQR